MYKLTLNSTKIKIAAMIISSSVLLEAAIGNQLDDSQITSEVKTLLAKEPDIAFNQLKVITNNGIVSVEGKVATRLQADRIIELINTIDEVKEVDAYKLKTTSSHQYMKDAFITAAVKGKIILLTKHGKLGRNSTFNIETTNGYVHVFGKVENKQEIDTLVKKIYSIKGVKEVKHSIEIS